jgi:two-component system, NtrC family, sensor kinase
MAYLIVCNGILQGKSLPVSGTLDTIGRNSTNSIILPDHCISRFHAEIRFQDNQYWLRDLQSTHGAFVNGARCQPELPLVPGDRLRLGKIELLLSSTAEAEGDSWVFPAGSREKGQMPFSAKGHETISYQLPAGRESFAGNLVHQHSDLLSRMAESLQSVFDLDDRLRALMDIVFDVFKPDRGAILLREKEEDPLELRFRRPEDNLLTISRTILDHAILQRHALLTFDAATDERFKASHSIAALNIRSAICAPLVNRNRVLGAIYIDSQSCSFTYQKDDLALLNLLAANAAISIENAILVREKLESERLAAIGMAMAGLSHFAKNILTGIMGASDLMNLALKKGDLPKLGRVWSMLQQSTDTLSTLVQDMLSYSKRREPEWQDANLNEIVQAVFNLQYPRAQEQGIELFLELEEDLPNTQFEKKAIHDVVLNLLVNAIDACQGAKGIRIVVGTFLRPESDHVGAMTVDNGPGIPLEIQKKIFEPFFSTKGSKGTGLGLAMARKTIAEHGGQLTLESEPGHGATFRILLPVKACSDSSPSEETPALPR